MRYLKLFEGFDDIDYICKKWGIENYTINPDGTIDVDGDVYLNNKGLTELPLKFGTVSGVFDCEDNKLTTLEGAPNSVGGSFWCNYNQLTTLEWAPKEVGGGFYCSSNKLKTLEGSPKEVGGHFDCSNNKLTTLEGGPKEVGRDFDCCGNYLTTIEGFPVEVGGDFYCHGNPIHNIYELYPDYNTFLDSMEVYNYLRGTNIVKGRFSEAMEDINREIPESIPGYKYI